MEALPPVSETLPRPEQWPDPSAARSRAEAGSTPLVRRNTGWKPMLCYIGLLDCRAISQSYRRAPRVTTPRR
jgi:hypothetical protein